MVPPLSAPRVPAPPIEVVREQAPSVAPSRGPAATRDDTNGDLPTVQAQLMPPVTRVARAPDLAAASTAGGAQVAESDDVAHPAAPQTATATATAPAAVSDAETPSSGADVALAQDAPATLASPPIAPEPSSVPARVEPIPKAIMSVPA